MKIIINYSYNGVKQIQKYQIIMKKYILIYSKLYYNLKIFFMKKLIINGKIKIIFNKNQENIV